MNAELLHQRVLEAKEQASQWAQQAWQEGLADWEFDREKWAFTAEDLLDFKKLRNFDLNEAWQSISVQSDHK